MKLYRSAKHQVQWFAFAPEIGWVMFPAEVGGWQRRQPARGIDPLYLRELPLQMAFNTGIPSSSVSPVSVSPPIEFTGTAARVPGNVEPERKKKLKTKDVARAST
jgi:hypothetical protein